jgi:predicted ATPase/class 3 adenylate cyclase
MPSSDEAFRTYLEVGPEGQRTSEPLSGTVTFLFTDIEGSTLLWEEHPQAMSQALARHDAILVDAVESSGGHVVKTTGDGLFAVFGHAESAITAALAAQRSLVGAAWDPTCELRVRMGLHTGDAEFRDGDYHGSAVNRAARLTSAGHGGQVLVSGATASLAVGRLADGAELVGLGEHRLRDLGQPEVLYQLCHPDLPRRFPPLRTLDAFPGNLPLQVSSFIGRERELARIVAALDEARAVTLTGVGGVGKTRLALQVAARVLPRFREGAWLVELAPVRDLDGVPSALAAVFGVSARFGMTLQESLAEFLGTKRLLVLLDNCEHLLEPVAELVEFLVHSCAGLVVLATSREGLAVEGERIVPVPSLPSPAPDAGPGVAGQADAVRLFVERARAVDPDFTMTTENTAAVIQICRRLDGVPLAIELAAARVVAMSPAELVEGLQRRFDTLAGGRRRAVQRHQTLRAAINWSYDLLAEDERRLLVRLAIFSGGCTRAAAEAVCGDPPLAPRKVFGLLAALVGKSLVVAQRDGPETRYRLLETIREYGEERLAETGETELLRATHAEYYYQLADDLYRDLFGPRQATAARRVLAEQENLTAAVNHAIDTSNVDLALRLVSRTTNRGVRTGFRFILPVDAVLRLPGAADHPLYPLGLASAALDAAFRGDLTRSEAACQEALASKGRLGWDPDVDVLVSWARCLEAIAIGAWDEAAAHAEHTVELADSGQTEYLVVDILAAAAFAHTMAGNPEAAARRASQSLDLARRTGGPLSIAQSLTALAGAIADRERQRARALLAESLGMQATIESQRWYDTTFATLIASRLSDWPRVLTLAPGAIRGLHWAGDRPYLSAIFNVVARALASDQPESAAVLQGAARRLIPSVARAPRGTRVAGANATQPAGGAPSSASFLAELRSQTTAALRNGLGETRLHQLRAEGEAMDDDHAVAYALEVISRAGEG